MNLEYTDYSVIVVDNKSNYADIECLREYFNKKAKDNFVLVEAGENGGFAKGNNLGAKVASEKFDPEYFWFLNPDTEVDKKSLCFMTNKALHTKCDVVASLLVYFHDRSKIQGLACSFNKFTSIIKQIGNNQSPGLSESIDVSEKYYPIGASFLIKAEVYREIDGMSECYFLYFEELDLIEKLKKRGPIKFECAPNALVYHKEGGAIGSSSKSRPSNLAIRYMNRGYLLFYWRHYRLLFFVAIFRVLFNTIRFVVKADVGAVKNILLGAFFMFRGKIH